MMPCIQCHNALILILVLAFLLVFSTLWWPMSCNLIHNRDGSASPRSVAMAEASMCRQCIRPQSTWRSGFLIMLFSGCLIGYELTLMVMKRRGNISSGAEQVALVKRDFEKHLTICKSPLDQEARVVRHLGLVQYTDKHVNGLLPTYFDYGW